MAVFDQGGFDHVLHVFDGGNSAFAVGGLAALFHFQREFFRGGPIGTTDGGGGFEDRGGDPIPVKRNDISIAFDHIANRLH